MGKLTWFRMDFDVVAQMKKVCDNDYAKIGELFCAVMQTAETGESVAFSDQNLQTAYDMICVLVQRARSSYDKKCEKRAAAGSKGGKAKAAKQKSETAESANDLQPVFKPPSKSEFRNIAKHFCKDYEEQEYDEYKADDLFFELEKDHWEYHGLKITNKKTVDAIVVAELCTGGIVIRDMARNLAKLNYSFTVDDLEEFDSECRKDADDGRAPCFRWNGKEYSYSQMKAALQAYFFDEDETDEADDHDDPPKPSRDYSSF